MHVIVLPLTVVLEYFVARLLSPSTPDISRTCALECGRILTYIIPPDILDGTWTTAMHTLRLRRANDYVLQRCTIFQDENGGCFILLGLAFAIARTAFAIEKSHLSVKDGIGGDNRSGGE